MNANFRTISTIMIIVLVLVLIGIVIYYYNMPVKVSNIGTNLANSGDVLSANQNTSITNNENKSGEVETIISESGEINSESLKNNIEINELKKDGEKPSQVIITSEGSISNREKRQILNELDDTLMDLLDAVDKVQTVDESRLITEESEVQR